MRRSSIFVLCWFAYAGVWAADEAKDAKAEQQEVMLAAGPDVFIDPITGGPFSNRLLYGTYYEGAPRALSEEAGEKLKNDNNHKYVIRALTKGDQVVVRVLNPDCQFEKLRIEEKLRHTRFYDDIHAVVGKLGTKAAKPCPLEERHTLQNDRATLTITAVNKTHVEKDDAVLTVATGPKEHLFLGVDLPAARKTLKYDAATKTLQPQSDSPQVYLSINYSFGDVVGEEKHYRAWYEPLTLKVLFLPSRRPLDSVGVGVGYQLPKLDVVDLSGITVFGAKFWTKQDAISAQGTPLTNGATGQSWRVGVTYDIATGLKWLKSF